MNTKNNIETKKNWIDPELKKINKTDFIKGGAATNNLESGACYKVSS